jgi:hypothetical protein
MNTIVIALSIFGFSESKETTICVIDQCNNNICTVETPEGWVEVPRKSGDYEGKQVVCPIWLIEPT